MFRSKQATVRTEDDTISPRDIFFECPACSKSLVVDETAEGMIVECPQCHINVIVPPKTAQPFATPEPAAPAPTRAEPPARPPATGSAGTSDIAALQERLGVLASQMREWQTQWVEVSNRVASRINEINRDLVILARQDVAHKQMLQEWNQIVADIATAGQAAARQTLPKPPQP